MDKGQIRRAGHARRASGEQGFYYDLYKSQFEEAVVEAV